MTVFVVRADIRLDLDQRAANDPNRIGSTESMLSRHKKTEAPSWQSKLVLFMGALFGATLLLFVAYAVTLLIDWARVDDCLDMGGSYDYERGECDFEANHVVPDN